MALDAGMDAYLTKPYKPEEIFQRIAVLLFSKQEISHLTTSQAAVKTENKDQEGKSNQSFFWHKPAQGNLV